MTTVAPGKRTGIDFVIALASFVLGVAGVFALPRALLMLPLPRSFAVADWRYPYGVDLARHGYLWEFCLPPLLIGGTQIALAVLANRRARAANRRRSTAAVGIIVGGLVVAATLVMAFISLDVAITG